MDNYNFCDKHTDTQTDRHGDSITVPAQRVESVKNEGRSELAQMLGALLMDFLMLASLKGVEHLMTANSGNAHI